MTKIDLTFYRRFELKDSPGVLYFGRYPGTEELMELKSLGVSIVWNLAAELYEVFEQEKELFDDVVYSEVEDYSIPNLDSRFLSEAKKVRDYLNSGKKVYVHCFAGHGRTGMALSTLGVLMNEQSASEALLSAKAFCGGPEADCQVEFIKKLFG